MILSPVTRVRGDAPRAIVAECLRRGTPVVFEGLIDGWPAVGKWSPRGLATRLSRQRVELQDFTRRGALSTTFPAFVDWMEGAREGALAAHEEGLYLAWDASVLGALREDFDFASLFPRGPGFTRSAFWMGPAGAHTPLHHDLDAPNLHAVLHGAKRFVLFAPAESARLSPADVYEWTTVFSEIDLRAPDLARHPAFADARGLEVTLRAGEVLLIPVRWWHAVWCLEASVSLNGWWFGPSLLASAPLWREVWRAALHRLGLHAAQRCTCCGHGDLRRLLGWGGRSLEHSRNARGAIEGRSL